MSPRSTRNAPSGPRAVPGCQNPLVARESKRPDLGVLLGIGLTFFTLGVTVNVLVLERTGSELRTVVAALVVNAATTELAYLAVRDAGGGLLAGLVAGWVVATRFGLLAAGLGARLEVGRWHRAAAGLQSFDPNVGVAVQEAKPRDVIAVFWWVTLAMHLGWVSGTLIGVFLGNVIGDAERLGLDAVFPALLLAVIASLLRRRDGLAAAVIGGAICAVLIPVLPAGVPIILSLAGAVAALTIPERSP
jgi:predicted branched-subunit amino acid permease